MQSVMVDGRLQTPSKIVCVGRNYVRHIEELGNEIAEQMVVFLKPNSAISQELCASRDGESVHYEGEIALMVRGGRFVAAAFGLDLTRRELQTRLKSSGLPWERAKSFDGSALFSPFVTLNGPPEELSLRLIIDGEERQSGGVDLMLYPPPAILNDLQSFLTLEDGDIVMTGTPAGVGEVPSGATFHGQLYAGSEVISEHTWQAQG